VSVVGVLAVALDLGGDQDEVDRFGAVDEVSQSEPGRGDFWPGEVLGAQPALGDPVKPGLGLLVAVLLAVGQMFLRAARPHDAVLAVTSPDDPAHEADEHQLPRQDVLIYRVDAPLFFANVGRVEQRIHALAAICGPGLRFLILDAEAVFYLDATAAETMAGLTVDLRERGCELLTWTFSGRVCSPLRGRRHGHDLPSWRSG
jgi:hypothetical protein